MSFVRRPLLLRLLIAAAAAVVLLGGLQPAARADSTPSGETVVGTVVRAYVEHQHEQDASARTDFGAPLTWVDSGNGDAVRVPTASLADVPVGATVAVRVGAEVTDTATTADQLAPAQQVLASSVVATAPATTAPTTPAVTDTVSIAMVAPPGTTPDGTTLATMESQVSGPVAQFWSDQSNGAIQIGLGAQLQDWITSTSTCADPEALWSEVAGRIGFTPGPGKHLLLYLPHGAPGCAYGLAEIGYGLHSGGYLYVQDTPTSVIAHELGHNFGLLHSGSQECNGSIETGPCDVQEYGDLYDVMGASWSQVGSLNAAQSARLGLLPTAATTTITATDPSATVTLAPLSATSGVRAVKLVASNGSTYYLEDRAAVGQDAYLGQGSSIDWVGLGAGVLLHRAETTSASDSSMLLDPTPTSGSGYANDADDVFPVGRGVDVAGGSFQVTVQSAGLSGATLVVAALTGDPACLSRGSVSPSGVAFLDTTAGTSVVAVGGDRAVWTRPVGAGGWTSLGGQVLYGPATASAAGVSYVAAVGTDGALYLRSNSGSGWSPWTWLGGYLTSGPAVASLGAGHLRVFGRGADGRLWSREQVNGAWRSWTSLGGALSAQPAAAVDGSGQNVLASVRGTDGRIYQQSLAIGAGAGSYAEHNVAVCSSPALAAQQTAGAPAQAAFVDSRGIGHVLDADGTDHAIGGWLTSAAAVDTAGGSFLVAARGGDNGLWLYDARPGGGWSSLGGTLR